MFASSRRLQLGLVEHITLLLSEKWLLLTGDFTVGVCCTHYTQHNVQCLLLTGDCSGDRLRTLNYWRVHQWGVGCTHSTAVQCTIFASDRRLQWR